MFKHIKIANKLRDLYITQRQHEFEVKKQAADIDYIAMMCDVDLEEEVTEDEQI